ncbi:MAG: hypothetical protein A2Z83_04260 [Omnitrophica bacterium GWA2_52_8]|nr:MAG: hypothetical protein A2Z83_04260 [Omnitrophica bacterium GWA2_52_8]
MKFRRILFISLALLFCGRSLDLSLLTFSRGERPHHCCCASEVCRCRHAKGKICPLERKPAKYDRSSAGRALDGKPFWKAAGCGMKDEPSAVNGPAKDFNLGNEVIFFMPRAAGRFYPESAACPQLLLDSRQTKPPQALPFSAVYLF